MHLSWQLNCRQLRCSWSIACRRYIFIPDLIHGFNRLGRDNCKTGRETLKFWNLVRLILETLRYTDLAIFLYWQGLHMNFQGHYTVCQITASLSCLKQTTSEKDQEIFLNFLFMIWDSKLGDWNVFHRVFHTVLWQWVLYNSSLTARLMGPTSGPSGATGPRWVPCWPHEPCYLGCYQRVLFTRTFICHYNVLHSVIT